MQFSLRAVRISFGYSIEEVAEYCGINGNMLEGYEMDTALIPCDIIKKISNLFKVPLALIYVGSETECFKYNRNRVYKTNLIE